MFGTSLRPWITASLWMTTTGSWPSRRGSRWAISAARLKPSPSQLPGRFWPPFTMTPCSSIRPGQPMPTNGASLILSLAARSISSLAIAAMRSSACSRVGLSSRWRQCRCFHTAAFDRSPFFMLSSTMPTRRFVPPTSAARMASWPASTQLGASWTAPIRPALSGWLVMVRSSIVDAFAGQQHGSPSHRQLADMAGAEPAADHDALGALPVLQAQETAHHGGQLDGDTPRPRYGPGRPPGDRRQPASCRASTWRSPGSAYRQRDPRPVPEASRASPRGWRGRPGRWRGRRRSRLRRAAPRCRCRPSRPAGRDRRAPAPQAPTQSGYSRSLCCRE